MTDLNKVTIIGRLTKDIEVRYTNNNVAIGNFSLASRKGKKKNGNWEEETFFFDIVSYGKLVENLQKYLTKGCQIGVQGSLEHQRWEKNGQKFSKICIIAEEIYLLNHKSGNVSNSSEFIDYAKKEGAENVAQGLLPATDFNEEIPF